MSIFSSDIQSIALNLTHCKLEELIFICDKYLIPYLKYIRDHKDIFKTALSHNKTLGFEDVYKRMFENIFNPILERFSYPENNRRYVMCYYLNGINAIVTEWLNDNCSMAIEEVCEIITICIFGLQKQLIKNEQYQKEM